MAQRRCESPESCPSWARALLAGIISVCFLSLVNTEVAAQFGRTTDGVRGPNVFVDMQVLESLGPARTVPRALLPTLRQPRMPGIRGRETRFPNLRAPGGKIVLKRPSSLKPLLTRPAPRPPPAPKIASVRRSAAAPKPPRMLAKPAPKTRKPPLPTVLARPSLPPPRPSIAPPPREIVKHARRAVTPRSKSKRRAANLRAPRLMAPRPATAKSRTAMQKPKSMKAAPDPDFTATRVGGGNMVRLGFGGGQAKLSAPAIKQLDDVVAKLTKQSSLRLQLLAYAGGTGTSGSQARRLSLSRALAVRSYLIEKGIRSTRIDVRALGNQVKGSPADRVDVIIKNR
jgi:outer membrane protein OmpA-like peptidoglycan-associated protein